MGQLEDLSRKRIHEVRSEMADGHAKRDDRKGYNDLLTLMGMFLSSHLRAVDGLNFRIPYSAGFS
jgi:hypothetical protein